MRFHHVGIPATLPRDGEVYLEGAKLFVTPVEASPYSIEWLRFEPDSPMPREIQTSPHVAYEVDDLRAAIAGKTILIEPFSAMPGVEVAFVADAGAVIEFMHKGD